MAYELEYPSIAISSSNSERAAFIRRTYAHLAGAILAFALVEALIFRVIPSESLDSVMVQYLGSGLARLVLFLVFIGGGYLARTWAYSGASTAAQYTGLGVYVLLQAVLFVPLLWVLTRFVPPTEQREMLTQAGVLTLCLFGGLTATVFITRKDFSFLGPILCIASFLILGLIVLALIFNFSLGLWFSFAMVALASAFILYDTSNVLHRFRTDMHVAASLELFASVAVLFYYILLLLMSRRR
jgi:FtsH-binding integral membrane protein